MTCPRKRDMTFDSEAICPSRRADAPGAGPWGPPSCTRARPRSRLPRRVTVAMGRTQCDDDERRGKHGPGDDGTHAVRATVP